MIIQKFTGSINARILNPINSNENYRVHRLDMNKALNLEVKLETDDPSAFMFLGVFTKESTINNVNSDFFSSISSLINVNDQRGFLFGQGNLSGFISKDSFDPDDYIFQVINVQSQKNINYTLTISYEQGKCSSSEINPYLGFWAVSDRNFGRLSYEIKQRSDGSLYLKFYLGDNYNGFSKVSINGVTLTKTKKGYRRYFGIRFDESEYYYLNSANSNQLLLSPGGTTNPRNLFSEISIFNRLTNPNIVDFLDDSKLSKPTSVFEEFFNTNFLTGNPQFARDLKANDYPGIGKITQLKNQILSTGIIEKSVGTEIWPEPIGFDEQLAASSIRTYAPLELRNVAVTAAPFGSQNSLTFEIPSGSLQTGMLVQLSQLTGNAAEGIPIEWVNGLFRVQILSSEEEKSLVRFISQIAGSAARVTFITQSVYSEAQITITPRCLRVTTEATSRFFAGTINSNSPQILQLRNFSAIGGLNASQINRRVTVFSQISSTQFFVTTSFDIIASRNEETTTEGIVEICTFPRIPSLVNAINNLARSTCPPNPITLFFTEEPNSVSSYSRVRILGLIGEYKKLNGVHDANPTNFGRFNANNTKEIWKEGYYSPNRKHYFSLKIESNDLPSFNPAIHTENGKSFSIERIVPHLTDDSGYGDFADACLYLYWKQGVNTHARALFYVDQIEGKRNPSWEQMQFQIANILVEQGNNRNRGSDLVSSRPYLTSGTILPFGNLLNKNSYGDVPGNPIDANSRIDASRLAFIFLYRKYLDQNQLFNVYARVSGPVLNERVPGSDPNNENISNFMSTFGYGGNGTFVEYDTSNVENDQISIFFNRATPEPAKQFLLNNAYQDDGFTRQEFGGELILADPPVGVSAPGKGLLKNAEACKGKIVVYVEIEEEFDFNDEIIYQQAVDAGAIGVIVVTEIPDLNFVYGPGILPSGPIDDIMIYASSLPIGNELIGYDGVGDRNDPASYKLSTGVDSGYAGAFEIPLSLGRRVGSFNFQFSIIKSEFSNEQDIGYIYLPNTLLLDTTEVNPIFWEEYGKSTLIDQYAKMWAAILSTEFITASGKSKRLSEMDSIIIDNSNNTGGFDEVALALASFFGDNRPSLQFIFSSTGSGFSASTSLDELVGNLPPSDEIRLQYCNRTTDIECSKYQERYPNATFAGKSVIVLTSTDAFSAGDILPHYFRNVRADNYEDLGNDVKSILVGNIDGRLAGASGSLTPLNYPARTSILSFAPSILGITAPISSYQLTGENLFTYYNTHTKQPITSQLPEIKIDNAGGPIAAWFEDDGGFFQAFGFSSVYLRGEDSRYNRFKTISERPLPYDSDTYHHPFVEDAILAATE